MADTKVSALTAATALAAADLLPIVQGGTTKKITAATAGITSSIVRADLAATGGAGTSGSPWTGWEAVVGVANQVTMFPPGWYATATASQWAAIGAKYFGHGAILKWTGSTGAASAAVKFTSASGAATVVPTNMVFEGFDIRAGGAKRALWIDACDSSTFRDLRLRGSADRGLLTGWCVEVLFENVQVIDYDLVADASQMPAIGVEVAVGATASAYGCTGCTFTDLYVSHAATQAVLLSSGAFNTFNCLAAEGSAGPNLQIDAGFTNNTFIAPDTEVATNGVGALINGHDNTFINPVSSAALKWNFGTAVRGVIICPPENMDFSSGDITHVAMYATTWLKLGQRTPQGTPLLAEGVLSGGYGDHLLYYHNGTANKTITMI